MKKYWSREDTKEWLIQLENRLEDIDYYLNQTVAWCEDYGIYDDQMVFACAMITVAWVSEMRGEPLSKREAFEILGVKDFETAADEEFQLGEQFRNWELEDLLHTVVAKF